MTMTNTMKAILSWVAGFVAPALPTILPDMVQGHAPTSEHWWIFVSTLVVTLIALNSTKPNDHLNP